MAEKSGIEMVEEIYNRIILIEKRFTNIEQMMKELLNRSNTTLKSPPIISSVEPPQIKQEPIEAKVKTLGQIKKEGKLVVGVNVKIFDENNNLVKETRTNKSGEWMCLLKTGKYKAEYFLENMINASVNFNVLQGQTLIRVAQPA